jgi:hypothetical protein
VGVFMEGVSPRTVCVGLPERVHYAFDVQNSRLAMAWRGRFRDARGTWYARAGQLEKPAGEDALEFPSGPLVAELERSDDPWPATTGDEGSNHTLGRSFDEAGRPVFRYRVGSVVVSESLVPQLRSGGAVLSRRLDFESPDHRSREIDLRLATGQEIRRNPDQSFQVVGEPEFRVTIAPEDWRKNASVVPVPKGGSELRLHGDVGVRSTLGNTVLAEYPNRIEVEYSW